MKKRQRSWVILLGDTPDKFKVMLYFFLAFIPLYVLLAIIHESGHLIVAFLFGWEIVDIHIHLFPFVSSDVGASWVTIILPESFEMWQVIVYLCAGSVHTLLWGWVFFLIYYKLNVHLFLRVSFFLYAMMAQLEIFIYIIADVFFQSGGDWHVLYLINPLIVGVFFLIGLIQFYVYARYFHVFKRRAIHGRGEIPSESEGGDGDE